MSYFGDCCFGYSNSFILRYGGGVLGLGSKKPKNSCFTVSLTSSTEKNNFLVVCFDESNEYDVEEYYLYSPSNKEYPFLKIKSLKWEESNQQITFEMEEKQNFAKNSFSVSEMFQVEHANDLKKSCAVRKREEGRHKGYWWNCYLSIDDLEEENSKPSGIQLQDFRFLSIEN